MMVEVPVPQSDHAHETPPRRAGSIRRTSSVEQSWPRGSDAPAVLVGRARDILTHSPDAAPEVLAEDRMLVTLSPARLIESFECDPPLPVEMNLVGQSSLRGYRAAIAPAMARPDFADRPLALLMDDLVGSAIIATWVKLRCDNLMPSAAALAARENVCTGYATGSPALNAVDGQFVDVALPPLERPDDPHSFHTLAPDTERTVRRCRRIDLWRTEEGFAIDAMFQDSGVLPGLARIALHEYRFLAAAREIGGRIVLTRLDIVPGALPYRSCLNAPLTATRLYGIPLADLRERVLKELRGAAGCTHLNDALRSISAMASLGRTLQA